ncbi:MAG: hypothetical protein M1832_002944 [Thelocarpon impressellum]|nr:MAG: hypothetical protein M1832_002944 [Thelocarpon impressellum]
MANLDTKCADASLQLDVDEMILDYMLHSAVKALLEDHPTQGRDHRDPQPLSTSVESSLAIVDCKPTYLALFKLNHPSHVVPPGVRFRLSLLKFTVIFTRRFQPSSTPPLSSLEQLRLRNQNRANDWLWREPSTSVVPSLHDPDTAQYKAATPLSEGELRRNRDEVLAAHLHPPFPDVHYGVPASLSLLDTLTPFMALSATVAPIGGGRSVTGVWMSTAAEYMLQAALEQYRAFGASGAQTLREAFAWGHNPRMEIERDDDGDESKINAMFWGAEGEVTGEWEKVKAHYLAMLIPPPSLPLHTHLDTISRRLPTAAFEAKVIDFLHGLANFPERPLLAQLEAGKLDSFGLGAAETSALRQRCGV